MSARRNKNIGMALGLGAALAYGTSSVLVKHGVADLTTPLVGAALSLLSGTIIMALFELRRPEPNLLQKKKSILFLWLAGVFAGSGIISSFFALSNAPVVIVTPLQSTIPLFVLILSHLFLGSMEKITPRIVFGTILVVGGIALVAIGPVM